MNSRSDDAAFLVASAGISFLLLSVISRLPTAMTLVGSILFLADKRDSFVEAGALSGIVGLSAAAGAPVVGAAADRWGQRIILVIACIASAAGLIALVALVDGGYSFIALAMTGAIAGVSSPQIGSMARSRWMGMTDARRPGALQLALGWESTVDEIAFIVGPLLVAGLGAAFGTEAPLLAAAGITLTFGVAFACHRTHALARRRSTSRPAAPLRSLVSVRLLLLLAGITLMGAFWGSSLATATAKADAMGRISEGGLIYGAMAVGSAVTALLAGLLPHRFPMHLRWLMGSVLLLVAAVGIFFALTIISLAVWYGIAGLGVGLTIVSLFNLGASAAPPGRATTTMTSMSSGLTLGRAGATVLAASLVSAGGVVGGSLSVAAVSVVMLVAAAVYVALRPAEHQLHPA